MNLLFISFIQYKMAFMLFYKPIFGLLSINCPNHIIEGKECIYKSYNILPLSTPNKQYNV